MNFSYIILSIERQKKKVAVEQIIAKKYFCSIVYKWDQIAVILS